MIYFSRYNVLFAAVILLFCETLFAVPYGHIINLVALILLIVSLFVDTAVVK